MLSPRPHAFPHPATGPAALRACLVALAALAGVAPNAHAQVIDQDATLLLSDGDDGDFFGWAVAADGDAIVVGAPRKDLPGANFAGAAALFPAGTGPGIPLVPPGAPTAVDIFGFAVAIDDGIVAVGRPGWNDQSFRAIGDVMLFDAEDGELLTRLLPFDLGVNTEFGSDVAIDGDVLVVGAFRDSSAGNQAGSVYVYSLANAPFFIPDWGKCLAPDAGPVDQLGTSVDVSGTLVIAGAPLDDAPDAISAGSARLFRVGPDADPVQLATLTAPDPGASDNFGFSVAIDGDLAIVGAPGVAPPGKGPQTGSTGAVYVFDISTPSQPALRSVLRASDAGSPGDFGYDVALDDDTAVVGARTQDIPAGPQAGAGVAYDLSDPGSPVRLGRLIDTTVVTGDRAGHAVAVSGRTALVGVPEDNNASGFEGGSVGVFTLPACGADFNADGTVNVLDVIDAITAFQAGVDINQDGAVNVLDVLGFILLWNEGCD